MKKLSILGLVLMAASAVTAAFIPSKKSAAPAACNGQLVQSAAGDYTCTVGATAGQCGTVTVNGQATSTVSGTGITAQNATKGTLAQPC